MKGHIEATRLIYTDRAKVVPIIIKYTKLPADVVNKALDFMIEKCIWDPAPASPDELHCRER